MRGPSGWGAGPRSQMGRCLCRALAGLPPAAPLAHSGTSQGETARNTMVFRKFLKNPAVLLSN